jgi:hypothetical protein
MTPTKAFFGRIIGVRLSTLIVLNPSVALPSIPVTVVPRMPGVKSPFSRGEFENPAREILHSRRYWHTEASEGLQRTRRPSIRNREREEIGNLKSSRT